MECLDALVPPCRKEGIEAPLDVFLRRHVKAVCHLLHGARNAVVELVEIMQARLPAPICLPHQAHIDAADQLGLFLVIVLKM